ncbi:hypothetical protein ETH_00005565 [Eimeria tenella]|uniref:PH domain-containing protein n=1 Tax=Eimeria tenella TaxID=5802 RepID=U6KNM1_EIMTE|nr:hypothetical protein ETH_00005565 [Eimeria tenella]CDJ39581.1 hypothetical protein ETH_00005565 [Eimeria tenella]|eukprot:XP_013230336.1 hypothetical protein ETH_00005565 [Eimeria tenella]
MLFEKAGDPQPILRLHNGDCVTHADAANREFVITHKLEINLNLKVGASRWGVRTDLDWYKKLEENGFLRRKVDQRGTKANQVGVVSKGCLELYRDYGSPGAKPVISLLASRCTATASRERREIRILHSSPSGKRERITLDCASLAEFDRWNVALHFGNFLKGEAIQGNGSQAYANLTKYVFPINMFEDASGRKSALLIENRKIMLFPTPDASDPILCFDASECEVQPVIAQRKLRVYVNICCCLPKRRLSRSHRRKAGGETFHPHAHAELTLEVSKYSFSTEGWEFALKIVGFKPFANVQLPRFFLPQIMCA